MSETNHPVEWVESMYKIQPIKCRGCECSHIVYSKPDNDMVWECELAAIGELCYLEVPDDE